MQFAQDIAEKCRDDLASALFSLITVVELTDLDERGHDVVPDVAFAGVHTCDEVIESRARDPTLERPPQLHIGELLGGSVDRGFRYSGVLGEERAHAAHGSTHGHAQEEFFKLHRPSVALTCGRGVEVLTPLR